MFAGLRGFETSLRPSLRARRAAERLGRRRSADARMIRRTLEAATARSPAAAPAT